MAQHIKQGILQQNKLKHMMMTTMMVMMMMMREVEGGKDWRIMTGGRQCNLTHRSNQNTIDRCDDDDYHGDDDDNLDDDHGHDHDHDHGEEKYDCVRNAELASLKGCLSKKI